MDPITPLEDLIDQQPSLSDNVVIRAFADKVLCFIKTWLSQLDDDLLVGDVKKIFSSLKGFVVDIISLMK